MFHTILILGVLFIIGAAVIELLTDISTYHRTVRGAESIRSRLARYTDIMHKLHDTGWDYNDLISGARGAYNTLRPRNTAGV